jgi:hypothetical protein
VSIDTLTPEQAKYLESWPGRKGPNACPIQIFRIDLTGQVLSTHLQKLFEIFQDANTAIKRVNEA